MIKLKYLFAKMGIPAGGATHSVEADPEEKVPESVRQMHWISREKAHLQHKMRTLFRRHRSRESRQCTAVSDRLQHWKYILWE